MHEIQQSTDNNNPEYKETYTKIQNQNRKDQSLVTCKSYHILKLHITELINDPYVVTVLPINVICHR